MPLIVRQMPTMSFSANSTTGSITLLDDAWALSIVSPTVTASAVTVQVEISSSGSNWQPLYSGGAVVTMGSGQTLVISPVPFQQLRIVSSNTETATFTAAKTILV